MLIKSHQNFTTKHTKNTKGPAHAHRTVLGAKVREAHIIARAETSVIGTRAKPALVLLVCLVVKQVSARRRRLRHRR